MKSPKRNHIYKYDKKRKKVIIIDPETGEEIRRQDDKLTAMLDYLNERNQDAALRKFAIWCAKQPEVKWKPIMQKLLRMAEDAVYEDIEKSELKKVYEETEGEAISTDSVGLQQGNLSAPAFLAVRACINPDAYEAAQEASRYHKLWVEMEYKHRNDDLSTDDAEEVNKNTLEQVNRAQIDYLLELIADQLPDNLQQPVNGKS